MKKFIVLGIVLLPCLAQAAATGCKVVEYADHSELVCVGDEKYVPAPAPQAEFAPPAVPAPAPAQQSVTPPTDGTAAAASPSPAPAMPASAAPQSALPQAPVFQRQGRPPQAVMDAAKAMREQAIQERLQQQQQQ